MATGFTSFTLALRDHAQTRVELSKEIEQMQKNDGSALEEEVAILIGKMLASGELPYRAELVKFKAKAKYFSRARGADVEFENVLEVFVTDHVDMDGEQPTHVVCFECKDHGRPVVRKSDEEGKWVAVRAYLGGGLPRNKTKDEHNI